MLKNRFSVARVTFAFILALVVVFGSNPATAQSKYNKIDVVRGENVTMVLLPPGETIADKLKPGLVVVCKGDLQSFRYGEIPKIRENGAEAINHTHPARS